MTLSEDEARALRVGAQLLHRPEGGMPPGEIVRRLCGVQAQVLSAAALALRARTTGLTAAQVDDARLRDRSVVWTWAMRGTLHLVALDDVAWLLPLVAPSFVTGARRRLAQLGLAGEEHEKAVRTIRDGLAAQGPLTRAEISDWLARRGVRADGRAVFHLVRLAALEGVACAGPEKDGETAFALVRDWVGPPRRLPRDVALGDLARRYVAAYGPADPADLAAWSGLKLSDARSGWRGIAGDLVEVSFGGRSAWMLGCHERGDAPQGVLRLLPSFDPYLLGYRSRELAVAREHSRKVLPGGGWLHPVVLLDGRAVATWRAQPRGANLTVEVEPFTTLDPGVEEVLSEEADDVAAFRGLRGELVVLS